MKNVIVTGANGCIGSSLIRRLIQEGVKVTAIDISFISSRLPQSDLITEIEAPVDKHLEELIPSADYDAFYHFAWQGVNGPDKTDPIIQLTNAQLAIICAGICKKVGCRRFLCAGTVAEQTVKSLPHLTETSGGMMYGIGKYCTHLMLESYCKNIGLDFVWMQFSNIYGVGNRTGNLVSYTLSEIIAGRVATFGPALQPYDFVYIDDLIEAVYRLGEAKITQNSYFIGSGIPRVLRDYLLRIGELTSQQERIQIGVRPDDGIRYDMSMFDTTPLVQDIGEYVRHTFDEGILKTYQCLRDASR